MPSTNKTPKLKLNQFIGTDHLKIADYNADMLLLDSLSGFKVLGMYVTLAALQAAHPTGAAGDAYAVGTEASNVVYLWNVNQWVSIGSLAAGFPYEITEDPPPNVIPEENRKFAGWTVTGSATLNQNTSMPEWGTTQATEILIDGALGGMSGIMLLIDSVEAGTYTHKVYVKNTGADTISIVTDQGPPSVTISPGQSQLVTVDSAAFFTDPEQTVYGVSLGLLCVGATSFACIAYAPAIFPQGSSGETPILATKQYVDSAVEELFTSVSDGKTALVADIETMGGAVEQAGDVPTFGELSAGILSIPAGGGDLSRMIIANVSAVADSPAWALPKVSLPVTVNVGAAVSTDVRTI